jgi:hypothetical protein
MIGLHEKVRLQYKYVLWEMVSFDFARGEAERLYFKLCI